jgi:hypothetical protein
MFAAAHLTYGFFWTKLSVYFLAGISFAVTAHRPDRSCLASLST